MGAEEHEERRSIDGTLELGEDIVGGRGFNVSCRSHATSKGDWLTMFFVFNFLELMS